MLKRRMPMFLRLSSLLFRESRSQAGLRNRRFLAGVGVGFLKTMGVGFRCCCPTPDVQLDYFLHHTPKFLLKWYNFFWNYCWNRISCSAPRFQSTLTARFHSLYVKDSESDILKSRSRIFSLRLRNPGLKHRCGTEMSSHQISDGTDFIGQLIEWFTMTCAEFPQPHNTRPGRERFLYSHHYMKQRFVTVHQTWRGRNKNISKVGKLW